MISCISINKIYKNGVSETSAVTDASFEIQDGEFVAITGPSGSGKSTLMHILGCLDKPTSGLYFLDGRNVAELAENELAKTRAKKIGFVFQAFNLLPRATALRNVELPLLYAGVPTSERALWAREALKRAAFPEAFFEHHSNELSGGMMQRVAIARALVNNPTLILADEPTGNLDSKTGEAVLETMKTLHQARGRTVVLITHEPYVASCAERIIHIKDGTIVSDEKV